MTKFTSIRFTSIRFKQMAHPTKWSVDITRGPPSLLSSVIGTTLQASLVGCWIGGFVSPFVAAYYGLVKGRRDILYGFLGIVVFGELWPKRVRWNSFRQFYVKLLPQPFKSHTIKMETLPEKEKPSIMVYHPHGAFSWGFITSGGWQEYFNTRGGIGLVANSLLHAPFFRAIFVNLAGSIEGADKATMIRKMKKGISLGLIPGGFEEATISCLGKDRVYLKKRKGFVKYALQYGYSLTPVYTFGECNLYWNLQGCWGLRHWMNAQKVPAIVCFGRWWCPLLPRSVDVATIGGTPLVLPKIDNPTKADIDEWHGKYCEALVAHYERWEGEYGAYNGKRGLEVW